MGIARGKALRRCRETLQRNIIHLVSRVRLQDHFQAGETKLFLSLTHLTPTGKKHFRAGIA